MKNIAVCLCSDDNYAQHMGATIASVLKNKRVDEFINIYIIDGGISELNKTKLVFFEENYDCKLHFLAPDVDRLKNCMTFKGDHVSVAAYYRLLIPELIAADKVIYLDSDTIVCKSLSELYDLDFGKNLVLAVEDISLDAHAKRLGTLKYVNSGVLLINSKQMREENTIEHMFSWFNANSQKIEYHDQDIINGSLDGRIGLIDDSFNTQVYRNIETRFSKIKEPVVLHFISAKKPWTYWKPLNSTFWSAEYFKALEGTPWEGFVREYNRKALLYLPFRIFYPTGFFKMVLKNIFSVTSCSDKKSRIVTILGLKFRVKRVKLKK